MLPTPKPARRIHYRAKIISVRGTGFGKGSGENWEWATKKTDAIIMNSEMKHSKVSNLQLKN